MTQILTRAVLLVSILGAAFPAAAQSPDNVLVVVNDASPASQRVAEYYVQKRAIPARNIVHLKAPTTDEISRAAFAATIEAPIATAIAKENLQDRIFYIVLTKGMPLRVGGTSGRSGTIASVDSELTLLYRKMTGATVPLDGPVLNPYFAGATPDVHALFSHAAQDIYLVTRLDGFTVEDAIALVDRSLSSTGANGTIVLDQRGGFGDKPNEWLATAAERLRATDWRERVVLETTSLPAKVDAPVLGYYSWGSNDPSLTARSPGVRFAPGALAGMFLSTDARTMNEPATEWKPGRISPPFAGSAQSLSADLVRAGASGVAGQVAEPYLDAAVRPEILFPGYVSGLNLAEAFYRALPSLSWQTVVLGDPLCGPYRTSTVPAGELDPAIDPETDLPKAFSERKLRALERNGPLALRKLLALSDARRAKNDVAGAIAALEKATALGTMPSGALRALGMLYEQADRYEEARAAYQRALEINPNDVIALNNLAYGLAVRGQSPREALPLAERAFTLANGAGVIADTLGWIKHLLGDDTAALPLLERAVTTNPANVEVQLHLAVVYAAAGRLQEAARVLKAARELDPAVEKRDEYQAAQKRIGGLTAR